MCESPLNGRGRRRLSARLPCSSSRHHNVPGEIRGEDGNVPRMLKVRIGKSSVKRKKRRGLLPEGRRLERRFNAALAPEPDSRTVPCQILRAAAVYRAQHEGAPRPSTQPARPSCTATEPSPGDRVVPTMRQPGVDMQDKYKVNVPVRAGGQWLQRFDASAPAGWILRHRPAFSHGRLACRLPLIRPMSRAIPLRISFPTERARDQVHPRKGLPVVQFPSTLSLPVRGIVPRFIDDEYTLPRADDDADG